MVDDTATTYLYLEGNQAIEIALPISTVEQHWLASLNDPEIERVLRLPSVTITWQTRILPCWVRMRKVVAIAAVSEDRHDDAADLAEVIAAARRESPELFGDDQLQTADAP